MKKKITATVCPFKNYVQHVLLCTTVTFILFKILNQTVNIFLKSLNHLIFPPEEYFTALHIILFALNSANNSVQEISRVKNLKRTKSFEVIFDLALSCF